MVRLMNRRLSKKFTRTPSGEVKIHYFKSKVDKVNCAIEGTRIYSASNNSKLSKTEKRPSVLFGGILSNKARDVIFEEAIKVKLNVKSIDDVKVSNRKYVEEALAKMEL